MTKILCFIRHTDIQITWVESHPHLTSRKQGWHYKQYGICLVSWSMYLRLLFLSWLSYCVYWGAFLILSSLMTLTVAECMFLALYFGCCRRCYCCCRRRRRCDVLVVKLKLSLSRCCLLLRCGTGIVLPVRRCGFLYGMPTMTVFVPFMQFVVFCQWRQQRTVKRKRVIFF